MEINKNKWYRLTDTNGNKFLIYYMSDGKSYIPETKTKQEDRLGRLIYLDKDETLMHGFLSAGFNNVLRNCTEIEEFNDIDFIYNIQMELFKHILNKKYHGYDEIEKILRSLIIIK